MKHVQAILYKFVIILVALEIVFSLLTNLTFGQIFVISTTVTIIAYLVGDMLVLPKASNNTIATLADFALAWATIYLFNYYYQGTTISVTDSFLAAAVIAMGEWMFHKYVASKVIRT